MALTREMIDRFMKVDPATMGHYIGSGFMKPEIKPIDKHSKIVGPAFTVRLQGKDSAAIYYAIKKAPRGSVLVVDRCGDKMYACCGEMVTLYAQGQGLAGIVIDGPATDSLAIEASGMPVFCAGLSTVTTNVLGISGEIDVPISCGGAVVKPGDIIFGDADGVVVVPPDNYERVLKLSEESVERELKARENYKAGGHPYFNIDRLMETDMDAVIASYKKFDV